MNETNQKNNAVAYCRVSTKEQVDEGNSLSTQEKICRDYAIKNDYDIKEIFVEQGESAKTADRTELQRLLGYCADKKNNIKAVIIYKIDRLSRNTDDYSQLRILLKRYGVEIKSTSEYFENTPQGKFMENMFANVAQFDNDVRAERCAGGMKDAMRDGRYVWMAPVGYSNVKIGGQSTIAPNETMAPIVRETFELVASGIYPTEEVRKIMTKKGLLNKKGNPFCKAYFYELLVNVVYTGWIVKFGEKHKGNFEPIISDELFNQVQRALKGKGRKHSAHITDHPDFPLRRFVVNEDTNKKLTGSWTKGRKERYPYYRFGSKNTNYHKNQFETEFMEYVDKFGFDEAKLKRLRELVKENLVKATMDDRKNIEKLKRQKVELTEKQSGIIKKNLDGVISDIVLKQQLAMIEKELFEIEATLSGLQDSEIDFEEALSFVEEYLKNPSKIWNEANVDKKLKLQWFQFPLGLTFSNGTFGTKEMCLFFKTKDAFSASVSGVVDPTRFELVTSSLQMMRSTN
jgi:site-specific DNA recombinase